MAAMTEKSTMLGREGRTISALQMIDTEGAKALINLLNAAVVAVNHADALAAQADAAKVASEAFETAEENLQAVLTVIPFVVQTFDPNHYPTVRWPKDLVGTTPNYQVEQLLPALAQGGKASVFIGEVLEAARDKRDKAETRSKSAVVHDARVKDRQVVARKELMSLLSKAEAFVRENTSAKDEARQLIQRPRPVDTRTADEKAAAAHARIDKQLVRAKAIEAKKAGEAAKRAAKAAGQAGTTPPAVPTPQATVVVLPTPVSAPGPAGAANSPPPGEVMNG